MDLMKFVYKCVIKRPREMACGNVDIALHTVRLVSACGQVLDFFQLMLKMFTEQKKILV
jgi:hypothetical protein